MGLTFHYHAGQTSLDEAEKQGLRIQTISTQNELNEFEHLNIENATEWLMSTKLKATTILTEAFIKKLHKKMYGTVWKWAGEFRKTNKNIGVEWPQVSLQVKQLLDDTKFWIANEIFSQSEIAIRFKHRLVAIHCFPNGNGRHSRIMADILMESIFKKAAFSWKGANMVKADETRKEYIKALKNADNGNILPLLNFANNK
jgi:Fic-DOC domain mobile mystery protein B